MSTQAAYAKRTGWIDFAAVVMFAIGFLRIITAISYYRHSHKINDLTGGLFSGHDWAWGTWDVIIAALAIFAGLSLLGGGGFGRVVAYIWAVLVIVHSFLIIGIAPWYGAAMIALAALVVYGLATSPSETEGGYA
jgi:hypothetical protein